MMRRPAAAVLALAVLSMALSGCGDDTVPSRTETRDGAASPSVTPGTRPTTPSPTVSTPHSPAGVHSPSPSPSPREATHEPAVDAEVTPETLAGYRTLSAGVNGFFVKAQRAEEQHPEANPETAAAIKALVDYTFPEGVDLVEYSNSDPMCFVGPEDTHMVFTEKRDSLRQIVGTGGCQYTDGDIIVDIGIDLSDDNPDEPSVVYTARVVKGANVVAQIPGFNDFVDVINASM